MDFNIIDVGAVPNDGTGDTLRTAFSKINQNFANIASGNIVVNSAVKSVAGRTGNVVLTFTDILGAAGNAFVSSLNSNVNILQAEVNSLEANIGSLRGQGLFKFVGNILTSQGGTAQNPDPSGNGNFDIVISPTLSGQAFMYLPTDDNSTASPLQITNNSGLVSITSSAGTTLSTNRGILSLGTDMESPGAPTHFHIAFSGSNSAVPQNDLFLGDDYNFVQVMAYSTGVAIGTNDRSGGNQNQWWFANDGSLVFPDYSTQNTAYQKFTSGYNINLANVSVDNFRAGINNSGNATIRAVSSNFNCAYTLTSILNQGGLWTSSYDGSSNMLYTESDIDIGLTLAEIGDQIVGTFQDTDAGKIYKVTWIGTASGVGYGCVIIEKII